MWRYLSLYLLLISVCLASRVWTEATIERPSTVPSSAQFGSALAIHGDKMVIAAKKMENSGYAALYERTDGIWAFKISLNIDGSQGLGRSVAMSEHKIAVADDNAIHVWYGNGAGSWTYTCDLSVQDNVLFDVSDDLLVTVATSNDGASGLDNRIDVFVFDAAGVNERRQCRRRPAVHEWWQCSLATVRVFGRLRPHSRLPSLRCWLLQA